MIGELSDGDKLMAALIYPKGQTVTVEAEAEFHKRLLGEYVDLLTEGGVPEAERTALTRKFAQRLSAGSRQGR